MFDVPTVLSLKSTFGNVDYSQFIPAFTLTEYEYYSIGQPVIMQRGSEQLENSVYVQTLMHGNQAGGGIGPAFRTIGTALKPFGNENFIRDHRILDIDFFDPDKVSRLIQYLHDVGSISFVILGEVGQRSIAADLAKYIVPKFGFHTIMYFNSWMSGKFLAGADDMKLGLLNMFDVRYCLPIFNRRKADGIGVSCSIITKKATIEYGAVHRLNCLDFVLNNYEDNLMIVDGAYLCEPWHIGSAIVRDFEAQAAVNLKVAGEKDLKKGSAEAIKAGKIDHGSWKASFDDVGHGWSTTTVNVSFDEGITYQDIDTSNLVFTTSNSTNSTSS